MTSLNPGAGQAKLDFDGHAVVNVREKNRCLLLQGCLRQLKQSDRQSAPERPW